MGALSNHVSLTITADSVGVARAGFGVPLIPSHNAAWAGDLVREYTTQADVLVDFASDSPEALAAGAMFGQSPRPSKVLIAKAPNQPTQVYTVGVPSLTANKAYSIAVKGEGVTATTCTGTAGASDDNNANVHNQLLTALNAVTGKNYTAAFAEVVVADDTFTASGSDAILTAVGHGLETGTGPLQLTTSGTLPAGLSLATDYYVIKLTDDTFSVATSLANAIAGTGVATTDTGSGTHTITDDAGTCYEPNEPIIVTGGAAGVWFSLAVSVPGDLDCRQTHSDPGIATDLAAILVERSDWYWLYTLYNSEAYVTAARGWAQTNRKLYVGTTEDSRDLGTSTGTAGTLDIAAAAGNTYFVPDWHVNPAAMSGAALIGTLAPREPGSWTAKFKRRTGVETLNLTATQRANLVARYANFYESVKGVNITSEGNTSAGPSDVRGFIDNVVNLDWLEDDMASGVFGALASAPKVPRTNKGGVVVKNEIRGSLSRAVTRKILVGDPAPVVTVPDIADQADLLPRGFRASFSGTLQGAIHTVAITGVVAQ